MPTPRLGTMLLALVLAPATLSAQPAHAALATSPGYCHSTYTSQWPDCIPLPPNSKDYRGEPIAVEDKLRATGLNCDKYLNVLANDRIEKKSKLKRIQITEQRPKWSGIHASVHGRKIRLRFVDAPWGGSGVTYRVVDYKGRKSEPTHISVQVGFGYQGDKNGC